MPLPHIHPSVTCYKSHHCRCGGCKELAAKERFERRRGILSTRDYPHNHPSTNCYKTHGCRCDACKSLVSRRNHIIPNVLPQWEVDWLRKLVGYRPDVK